MNTMKDCGYGCLPDAELNRVLAYVFYGGGGIVMEPVLLSQSPYRWSYPMQVFLDGETAHSAWPFRQSNQDGPLGSWRHPHYFRICWN